MVLLLAWTFRSTPPVLTLTDPEEDATTVDRWHRCTHQELQIEGRDVKACKLLQSTAGG